MTTISNYYNSRISNQQAFNGFEFALNVMQQTGVFDSIWNAITTGVVSGLSSSTSSSSTNSSSSSIFSAPSGTLTQTTPSSTDAAKDKNDKQSEVEPTKTDKQIEQEVKNILKYDKDINVDFNSDAGKAILKDFVKKYNVIKEVNPNITNTELSRRICNYAKGYLYHQQENLFGLQKASQAYGKDLGYSNTVIENKDIKNAVDNNDMDAYKTAFHQQAKEYIEYYDDNSDGKIDVNEFIRKDVADLTEAIGEDLNQAEGTSTQNDALRQIANFDMNGDNKLDENEIAGYLWARNNWQGQGYNMTYAEFKDFETSINGSDADAFGKAFQAFKNGYEGLK